MSKALLVLILVSITNGCATSPVAGNRVWKSREGATNIQKDFPECAQKPNFQVCMEFKGHFLISEDATVEEYLAWASRQ